MGLESKAHDSLKGSWEYGCDEATLIVCRGGCLDNVVLSLHFLHLLAWTVGVEQGGAPLSNFSKSLLPNAFSISKTSYRNYKVWFTETGLAMDDSAEWYKVILS